MQGVDLTFPVRVGVLSFVFGKVVVKIVTSTPVKPMNVLYVRHALGGKH